MLTFEREFPFFQAHCESTSSFVVSKFKGWTALAKLNWYGGFIERVKLEIVEAVYDLCQPSMFTTTFPANKTVSIFFFPFGNLSLCDRKHESDQNPERTQAKLFPHWEPWGRRLGWLHLISFRKVTLRFLIWTNKGNGWQRIDYACLY